MTSPGLGTEEVDSWRLRGVVLQYNLNVHQNVLLGYFQYIGRKLARPSSDIPIACENVLYHYLSLFKLAF